MKTILLFITLTGFTAVGSYAQNKDCCCKHKTAADKTVKAPVIVPRVLPKSQTPTCFLLKKENFGVPGCTDVIYGNSNDYLGYYLPKSKSAYKTVKTITKQPEPQKAIFKKVSDEVVIPCYTYQQHNIVVRECPGVFYDNERWPLTDAGVLEYNIDTTYMGYYPGKDDNINIKDPAKPENKPIEGTNFPGDNLCFRNCK